MPHACTPEQYISTILMIFSTLIEHKFSFRMWGRETNVRHTLQLKIQKRHIHDKCDKHDPIENLFKGLHYNSRDYLNIHKGHAFFCLWNYICKICLPNILSEWGWWYLICSLDYLNFVADICWFILTLFYFTVKCR